jgi:hypothetical protein
MPSNNRPLFFAKSRSLTVLDNKLSCPGRSETGACGRVGWIYRLTQIVSCFTKIGRRKAVAARLCLFWRTANVTEVWLALGNKQLGDLAG